VSENLHNKLGNMLLYKCNDEYYRYVKIRKWPLGL
jgi:hypothetical protein